MSTRSKKRQAIEADLIDTNCNPHKKRRLCVTRHDEDISNKNNNKISKEENDDFMFNDFDDDNNDEFDDDNEDNGDWDDCDLNYGQQQIAIYNDDDIDSSELLQRAKEKRRILNSSLNKFWKCGKCEFLNHPSCGMCISCNMPEMEIIRYALNCNESLKQCLKCNAFIIPNQFEDHELDCNPMIISNKDSIKNQWYIDLSKAEKNAVQYVTNFAFDKSQKNGEKEKLLKTICEINKENELLFGDENEEEQILNELNAFLEWKVPITIRIHCKRLIPKLLNDTNYRNLFETGYGSGNNDQSIRKREETKMFGDVYFGSDPTERPKYGCLNINLKDEGCTLAHQYGDGYFVMNDTTVRWRVTMTIKDSFQVNGNCGTLKHCIHLLNQLNREELKEIIYVAKFGKHDEKNKQKAYREIQIHGPIQLNRDIYSLHIPDNKKNRESHHIYKSFCKANHIKLVWF